MWGKKRIQGVEYDLSHLDPFVMPVTPKTPGARTFQVRVSYGLHTFTRGVDDADKPDLHVRHNAETRSFCFQRYGYSLHLPDILRNAANGRAHFSAGQNFLLVRNVPGASGPYAVFFDVEKARKAAWDALLFVDSAYVKPGLPMSLKTITIPTIVGKTVQGVPIIRPKK